jgi:hypothetical protein
MSSREGSVITFEDIKDVIFPTLSIETYSILPDQDYALDSLDIFNIDEDDSVIYSPIIEIVLEPYLLYKVTGKMDSGLQEGKLYINHYFQH